MGEVIGHPIRLTWLGRRNLKNVRITGTGSGFGSPLIG